MTRIEERVAAAIERASCKYFPIPLVFVPEGSGEREVPIHAIRRDVAPDQFNSLDAPTTARVFELIVSKKDFLAIFPNDDVKNDVLRNGRLVDRRDGRSTVYRFNARLPYTENSPNGASFRLYVYEAHK